MSNEYLSIKDASKMLGVTPLTLRNWDKNGKLKAYRHPMNNYRVYKIEDIERILNGIETGEKIKKKDDREFKKITIRHIPGYE
jgi:MerR family copper efflux transcriptional regulator